MVPDRLIRRLQSAAVLMAAVVVGSCSIVDFDRAADRMRAAATPGTAIAATSPEDFPVHGIDVSKYQDDVDWPAVRRAGKSFAWIKATEGGDRIDERFARNWSGAKAAGIARGAYHFWYHCRRGSEQAAWFIRNVPVDDAALPPVLDMEWTPDSPTCTDRPDKATLHAEMRDWLKAIERHYGKRPVIYTSVDFHRDRMVGAFEDYHIWVRSVAGHPSIRYGNRRWHFWQHTATGRVDGVAGDVDRNVFYGSAADFSRFLAGTHSP